MKIVIHRMTLALIATLITSTASAQTLTEQLSKEPAEKLVLEAQESGNVVRGAILFHQGNIACAKCHRPNSEKERIGPDLSRLGPDVLAASLVESILMPSKKIDKTYQASLVIRTNGLTTTGVVVDRNARSVVLRDAQDVSKLITIPAQDIEEIVAAKVSIMPEKLADELKNKQQFLDLLRYVMDQKERGPTLQSNAASVAVRTLAPEVKGLALIRKYNCAACHKADKAIANWVKPAAPDLRWTGKNVDDFWLKDHMEDPQRAKPSSTMPKLKLSQLPAEPNALSSPDSRALIIDFLVYASNPGTRLQPSPQQSDEEASAKRGRELFHEVGCVACHAPRDKNHAEIAVEGAVPLGDISRKYSQQSLAEFLLNPHQARPSGRMPNLQLSYREAVDISAYLQVPKASDADDFVFGIQSTGTPPGADKQRALKGRQLFIANRCSSCHTKIADSIPGPLPDQPESLPGLATLNPQKGCLAARPSPDVPQYTFATGDREAISAALAASSISPTPLQQIDLTLTHLNCTACHSRDQLGGVSAERKIHFQTTNLNLGEQGRIPPTLTGVGAKLKPKWLRDVLVNGRSIRPYMKTRMPKFGEDNVGHLVKLFEDEDSLPKTEFADFEDQKKTREFGHRLAGNQGLNCVACHTFQYKISDTMPAVDLTEMSERLKKDWFYQYMLAPQKFSPNTVMPSFWPAGKAIRPDLEGSPQDQVEALWQYLLDGRQARSPRGVLREPLEIQVTDRVRMLRRSYPEIGKRGIGVGYPGGVNLAWDAEQMRLATLWKGRFIDPSGVWYGQGHGRVRLLGDALQQPKGPELDDRNSPWVVDEGRPPEHMFRGYTLDEIGRPTFRYDFRSIRVTDTFLETVDPQSEQKGFKRTVELLAVATTEGLRFRLGAGKSIRQVSRSEYQIEERIKIRVPPDASPEVKTTDSGATLQIPIDLQAGESRSLTVEYRW